MKFLPRLLNHKRIPIVKDATWMLSNVMAGSVEQIQAAIDHNLLPILTNILHRVSFCFNWLVFLNINKYKYIYCREILKYKKKLLGQ